MGNNTTMSIENMISTMEKMLKNCKSKMNNAQDFIALNGFYKYGMGILSTAGNFQIIDKTKYNEYLDDLNKILADRVLVLYKVDLNISEHSNMDCNVVITNQHDLSILCDALKALGRLGDKTNNEILAMNEFPYIIDLDVSPCRFVGTTPTFNAIEETIKNGKTIVPFSQIYKGNDNK